MPGDHLIGRFKAMACPCEVLIDGTDDRVKLDALRIAEDEAARVEEKYSRYRTGNIVHRINAGEKVDVDEETAGLLNFADRCFELSGGLFDITSGVLRKAWTFDGSEQAPRTDLIIELLPLVGWKKVRWDGRSIQLEPGMQIDLGGIGKEYAVDRAVNLIKARHDVGFLVNFGGDIAIGNTRQADTPWLVGIEAVDREKAAVKVIEMRKGAITTSGDSRKYVTYGGKRHGHILDPVTGCPVEGAPRSVTVAAGTCTEAGFLSTFGMLSGENAETVLKEAGIRFWCYR